MNRQRLSYAGVSIALLVVCLIAVNVASYFVPLRWDATEEKLYTMSEGTKKILEGLNEPITLKFYFSRSNEEIPPQFKAYAQRVEDLLREYSQVSKKKVKLETFDPKPDSEEEQWAKKYGVNGVSLPSGNSLYFGLVAIMLDKEVAIPFFDPRREEFLEYDISQLILRTSTSKPAKIGVLSSLNVMPGPSFAMGQMANSEGWALISELQKNFTVEKLETSVQEIPDDVTLLLVIHPKDFSDRLQYAIDQFVLRGGKLMAMVDPSSREDAQSQQQMMGMPPNPTSNLPKLFQAWGVDYDAGKVLGDQRYATPVNAGPSGVVRYPLWMSLTGESLDKTHPVTSQLENLLFVEAGSIQKIKESEVEFTPLIQSSQESGVLETMMIRFARPDQVSRDLKPDQTQRALAGLFTGKFKTAFPGGQPPKPKEDKPEDPNQKSEEVPLRHSHLNEAKESNTILVIADTDFASDSFSVQRMNFLGQTIMQPVNDNLNFMQNTTEFISGNSDLMKIRSRGRFSRPFVRLLALEQQAQVRYQAEAVQLEQKLNEVKEKLQKLEQKSDSKQQIVLTPEIQKEIKNFRDEELKTSQRLREVRKILRQDIENLGHLLVALNLLVIPLLVAGAGIISYTRRVRRQRS